MNFDPEQTSLTPDPYQGQFESQTPVHTRGQPTLSLSFFNLYLSRASEKREFRHLKNVQPRKINIKHLNVSCFESERHIRMNSASLIINM